MKQAVLLDAADLTALRAGTPLTLQVGGAELLLYVIGKQPMPSFSGMRTIVQAMEQEADTNGPAPRPTRQPRRAWTDAKKREIVQTYLKFKKGTGERAEFLRRRKVSGGHFHHMMKEVIEKKKP